MDTIQEKSALRRELLRVRDQLTAQQRKDGSKVIADRAIDFIQSRTILKVHCYLSFRSEVDTSFLISQLHALGIEVVVPTLREDGSMQHVQFSRGDQLTERRFGIREPEELRIVSGVEAGAVLLPLVAFDRSGSRLGYGKGYYDRFLASLPGDTLRIGLAFAEQEVSLVPNEEHDQYLNYVITETELVECSIPLTRMHE